MTENELAEYEELFFTKHKYTTQTADFINFVVDNLPDGLHRLFAQSGLLGNTAFNLTKLCGIVSTKDNPQKLADLLDFHILISSAPSDCDLVIFTSKFDAMGQARQEPPTISAYNISDHIFNFSGETTQMNLTAGVASDHQFHRFNFVDAPAYSMDFDREKALAGINFI